MTISAQTTSVQYNGDGSTSAFSVTFQFWELEVVLISTTGVETVWTQGTQYTILSSSGATTGDGNTGTVNVQTVGPDYRPQTGEKLRITRKSTRTQGVDYVEGDAFPASTTENAFDRLTMIVQELYARTTRAPLMSEANALLYPNGFVLPAPVASKYIGWNSAATDLENKNSTGVWYTGSGAPSVSTGSTGDMYLDTASGDIYGPKTTVWGSIVGNIRGPTGAPGAPGAGTGDVVGPASAITARVATFNGTTGKIIQDGGKTIAEFALLIANTYTGKQTFVAGASGAASVNVPPGAAPSAPNAGDVWTTTTDILIRLNGVSETFAFISDLALYATLASPALTGNPTAPTASPGDNDISIATTAFVQAALSGVSSKVPHAVIVKTSGTSYTTPVGCTLIEVEVIGGGGAGVNGGSAGVPGPGGGGGGYAKKLYTVTGNTAYTYAVGAAAGNSTFTDGTTLITGGGASGQNGGTGTNGDINIAGEDGQSAGGTASGSGPGGQGGSSGNGMGAGGKGADTTGASAIGSAGKSYGGGGGGSVGTAASSTAAAGAVIIREYY